MGGILSRLHSPFTSWDPGERVEPVLGAAITLQGPRPHLDGWGRD